MDSIPPVVVGRWGIDAAILVKAHRKGIPVVDISNLRSYHQGRDASGANRSKVKPDDWKWNWRYITVKQGKVQGKLTSNYLVESKHYSVYSRRK